MNPNLSPRLLACSQYVHKGDRVADVGCDHGYLGIHLLQNELASYVYAGDVNDAPLQSAMQNSDRYGFNDKISFYLSDGLKNVPRDFDVAVCAGMGADTIISILENAQWLQGGQYRLILQCQSKTHCLRRYLSQNGWHIDREIAIRDGRFLYTVMDVIYRPGQLLTPGECYFSPALHTQQSPDARQYRQQVIWKLRRAISGQQENADPYMKQALLELEGTEQ